MLMNLKNFTLRSERLLVIALLACSTPHAFAISMVSEDSHNPVVNQQDTHVKGTVIDSRTGEPIIGANIVVKGTTNGTITGVDGDYSLKAPVGSVLEISFIGYKTVTVKAVAGLQKIRLQEDSSLLDEVVVVGYGTQKKVNLSGAVDAISSEALEDRPIINAGQGLQGVIPNLNITISNGAANSTPSFNIRGETSLNGGDPLILVDNIPTTSGELSRLNTNDIESVSVLKDAASAAIYGARAAFGVILVTTKRAKSEKIAINVNAFYSTRKVTRVPEHVTDPYTVMKIKHDAATPLYNLYPEKQLEIGKYFSEHPNEDRVVINPDDPESWLYYGSTDWMDEVYESSAPSYTVNFNISQKAKKTSYYLSGEYARQDGMLRYGNDIYDRYNIRGKVDFQITNWLNLSNNTSFVQRTYDQPSFGRTDWGLSDFFHEVNRTNSLDVPRNPDGSWTQSGGAILGALQEGGRKINDSREFSTTFGLTLDIIKDMWQIKADATWRRDSELNRNSYHNYHYKTGPNKPEQASGRPTRASRSTSFYNYNVYNVYTDFHYTFADKHYVQALLGFNQETRKTNSFSMYRDDLISSSFPTPELAVGEKGIGEDISEWAVRGMFFRVNYIYDDKYILEMNGRYDGTSRFPKNKRYGFFPSGSVAWRVDVEPFFEPLRSLFSQFKIRASYGSLGNQLVTEYGYIPSMNSSLGSYLIDGKLQQTVTAPGLVSPDYTWEQVRTLNGGIDLALWNNKLVVSFDIYRRDTKGMLTLGKELPGVLGKTEPKENAADLKTRGWELSVAYRDEFQLKGKPLNWGARFVLSDNRSWITKFDNPTKNLSQYYEGQELGEIWGLQSDGLFKSKEEIAALDETEIIPWGALEIVEGWPKYKDLDGDQRITKGTTVDKPGDLSVIGNSSPRFRFGLNLNAEWNGFDVSAFLHGIGKRDYYPVSYLYWSFYQQPYTGGQVHAFDFYRPTTDSDVEMAKHSQSYINAGLANQNLDSKYPVFQSWLADKNLGTGINGMGLAIPQTNYMLNGSYLRIKNITIGYTLPARWTKKTHLNRVRIYVSGDNLFEWSGLKKYFDPEAVTNSDSYGYVYPFNRQYSFGINVTL